MAVFLASNNAVRFDLFNVAGLLTGTEVSPPTPTTFAIGPDGNNFTTFSGTGFTYSGGLFNGGIINRIDSVAAAQPEFQFDGLSMPVAQFRAFVNAGNSQGFLAAVLAGNDKLTGSVFSDFLQGFAGNDLIVNDLGDTGDDTLDGGIGNDTVDGADGNDSLLGGIGIDMLAGSGGGDALNGGIGADTMDGGDGNDFYFVDNAKDSIAADSSGIDSVQSTVSYVLAADLEHLFLIGAGKLNGTGNASANQIVGSTGANKLLGLGGDDALNGGDGNDILDGGTGDDTMLGGAGNDVYFVDSMSDQAIESLAGKAGGIDTVFSSAAITLGANIENLTLTGSAGVSGHGNALNNLIIGNDSINELAGFDGNDTLNGGKGDDELHGGVGADVLIGGADKDTYIVDDLDKVMETLAGPAGGIDQVFYTGTGSYVLGKNFENLLLDAAALNGTGNGLVNEITGNDQANILDGKAGGDLLIGRGGNDIYLVDNALDVVDEASLGGAGIDTVKSSVDFNLTTNVLGDVEHLTLLGKASAGTGNGLDNQITGNAGKNLLSGLVGADTLDGGIGADTMLGAAGNDIYVIDSKLDVVNEAGADLGDQVNSSKISVDISALGMIENIALSGKAALSATGNDGNNMIAGNDGANKLFGLGANDFLFGGAGNDTLDGGAGSDVFEGSDGNDTYVVDGFDPGIINEASGAGTDTVISSAIVSSLFGADIGFVENLTLATGSSATKGIGNSLDNVLTGNELGNQLLGLEGNDTINGGDGNDGIDAAEGNDLVNGGAENDGIGGGPGNDTIDGGAGDDTVRGGADADVIIVSSGNDIILYSLGEGGDLIKGFDGNPLGGQDVLDLDGLFDGIPLASPDRASHVLILDHGATVDVLVDADNNLANGYELTVATIQTADAVSIGQDVLLGTL